MPHRVNFQVMDGKGEKATLTMYVQDSATPGDLILFAQQRAVNLVALVNGELLGVDIVWSVDLSSVTRPTANAASDVEERSRWVFMSADGFNMSHTLPCFKESVLLAAPATSVDMSDTDAASWRDVMINGYDASGAGGSGYVYPCDARGQRLTSLVGAREYFLRR